MKKGHELVQSVIDVRKLEHPHLSDNRYRSQLKALQLELMYFQLWLYRRQRRGVVLVEGPDAAGKGGAIRRAVRFMDPRSVRVHAIGPPNETEKGEHYLQRFWTRLPKKGQLAIFDRSWYGRVLVERVELGFTEWSRSYEEISNFEKMLIDDGVVVVKLLFYIDKEEQRKRLLSRLESPEKSWKLTEADLCGHEFHREYDQAFNDMLAATNSPVNWHVIAANDKNHTRVTAMKTLLDCWRAEFGEPADDILSAEFTARAKKLLSKTD